MYVQIKGAWHYIEGDVTACGIEVHDLPSWNRQSLVPGGEPAHCGPGIELAAVEEKPKGKKAKA